MRILPNDLEKDLLGRFQEIFKVQRLEELARQSRFIERSTSKISGDMFLKLNVLFESNNSESSLNDMCDFLEDHFNVRIKKQSLDERFNKEAVTFLKVCFSEVFNKTMSSTDFQPMRNHFSHIYITDSTAFKLPGTLKDLYRGTGTDSGLKILYTFDLAQGVCKHLDYRSASVNDADYLQEIEKEIVHGALYIKDLGFWRYSHFQRIHQEQAYFITRYKTNTQVFGTDKSGSEVLPIQALLPYATQGQYECEGFVGTKEKVPVRIVIQKVPLEVAKARIKKIKQKAASQKHQITDTSILLCNYNIYMTNASKEQLPYEFIQTVYRLRWQVELIFKAWKSIFELDKIKKMNASRFECYLLGRLILILLSTFTQNTLKQYLWEELGFELSEWKAHKSFKKSHFVN